MLQDAKKHVFISHSSHDRAIVDRVLAVLGSADIPYWFSARPSDLAPGSEWDDSIVAALEASAVVLLIFSRRANESRWVKKEIALASDLEIDIIPVRIEDVKPTRGLAAHLVTVNWISAYPGDVENFLPPVVRQLQALFPAAAQNPLSSEAVPPRSVEKGAPSATASKTLISTQIAEPATVRPTTVPSPRPILPLADANSTEATHAPPETALNPSAAPTNRNEPELFDKETWKILTPTPDPLAELPQLIDDMIAKQSSRVTSTPDKVDATLKTELLLTASPPAPETNAPLSPRYYDSSVWTGEPVKIPSIVPKLLRWMMMSLLLAGGAVVFGIVAKLVLGAIISWKS